MAGRRKKNEIYPAIIHESSSDQGDEVEADMSSLGKFMT
jgi:hypothetical protein